MDARTIIGCKNFVGLILEVVVTFTFHKLISISNDMVWMVPEIGMVTLGGGQHPYSFMLQFIKVVWQLILLVLKIMRPSWSWLFSVNNHSYPPTTVDNVQCHLYVSLCLFFSSLIMCSWRGPPTRKKSASLCFLYDLLVFQIPTQCSFILRSQASETLYI